MRLLLALVDSITKQAGVSTIAYSLGYTYSNWINRPALIVSVGSDSFYKDKCGLKRDFTSKPLSIVNGNARGVGELQVYCYKMNELLYYYQAHSTASTEAQHAMDLRIFLERASRTFGLVIVDMDSSPKGFAKLLDSADVCFCVLPPDHTVITQAEEEIREIFEDHRETVGLEARTVMRYVINKHERDVSISSISKRLEISSSKLFTVPYIKNILAESNRNHLTEFLNRTLIKPAGITEKTLELSLKRMYDFLRKG